MRVMYRLQVRRSQFLYIYLLLYSRTFPGPRPKYSAIALEKIFRLHASCQLGDVTEWPGRGAEVLTAGLTSLPCIDRERIAGSNARTRRRRRDRGSLQQLNLSMIYWTPTFRVLHRVRIPHEDRIRRGSFAARVLRCMAGRSNATT